jgi:hypothetical protein
MATDSRGRVPMQALNPNLSTPPGLYARTSKYSPMPLRAPVNAVAAPSPCAATLGKGRALASSPALSLAGSACRCNFKHANPVNYAWRAAV